MSSFAPSESDLSKAKEIMRGEQPLMSEPVDTTVALFRGVYDPSVGRWEGEARVKELTGADEEAIARMMGASSATQYINAVLTFGVVQVGQFDLEKMGVSERLGVLDLLLVGEKEMLFLNVLRVTYGDERTTPVTCQTCGAGNEVFFSLSEDVPVRKLDEPTRVTYEYTCRNGDRIEFRLVTGADQAEATKRPNTSMPEENTIIFSRVIDTVNGKPLVDPMRFARDLGAADRRGLIRDITAKQPGPYFEEVKLPCTACGAESLFTPSWADLL
jgi:hypothetical protein